MKGSSLGFQDPPALAETKIQSDTSTWADSSEAIGDMNSVSDHPLAVSSAGCSLSPSIYTATHD